MAYCRRWDAYRTPLIVLLTVAITVAAMLGPMVSTYWRARRNEARIESLETLVRSLSRQTAPPNEPSDGE